jgi:hypothetical protein
MKTFYRFLRLILKIIISFSFLFLITDHIFSRTTKLDQIFKYESINQTLNETTQLKVIRQKLTNKYLQYECDGGCGGWADRLKGILSSYAFALLTDRQFSLKITHPCNLDQIFIPNKIDYKQNVKINETNQVYLHLIDVNEFREKANEINLLDFHKDKEIIRVKTNNILINKFSENNYLKKKIVQLGFQPDSFKFRLLFSKWYNDLFKWAPKLKQKYKKAMSELGDAKLICAQIRIGGKRPHVSDDYQYNHLSVIEKFWHFINQTFINQLKSENKNYKIFISTDTEKVLVEANRTFGNDKMIKIEGMYTHLDRESNLGNDCSRVEKTFLDFDFMKHCHMAVVSASGYGMISIMNRPEPTLNLYKFDKDFIKINDMSQLHKDF